MATSPTFVGTPKIGLVQIANADGTNAKTVVTAGPSGSKVTGLILTSTEASANTRIIQISITRSSTAYILGSASVTYGAGTDGSTASINGFSTTSIPGIPVDNDGQPYIFLQSGDTLTATLNTGSVTSGKIVSVTAIYADF